MFVIPLVQFYTVFFVLHFYSLYFISTVKYYYLRVIIKC